MIGYVQQFVKHLIYVMKKDFDVVELDTVLQAFTIEKKQNGPKEAEPPQAESKDKKENARAQAKDNANADAPVTTENQAMVTLLAAEATVEDVATDSHRGCLDKNAIKEFQNILIGIALPCNH